MEAALTGMRRFAQWGLWFGGALVLLAALLIGIDVLMRKFLDRSIGGADELAGYALAIGIGVGPRRGAARSRAYPHRLALHAVPAEAAPGARPRWRSCCSSASSPWSPGTACGVVSQSWTSGSRSQSAAGDADRDPAGALDRGAPPVRRGRRRCCCSRRCRLKARRSARRGARLIGTRSAEEEVEDEIRDSRRSVRPTEERS